MAAILKDGKLTLSGDVGDFYFGDCFTYTDVVLALAEVEDNSLLTVHLNSGGGIATEGAAIHALFAGRSGITNIVVSGIAASAASLIAMAGDTVTMSAGALMMIHDPSAFTFGTSDEHAETIKGLEALATAYARVYAGKSGKSAEECREIMKRTVWLTPDDAVAEGFADATLEGGAEAVAAFDYRAYAGAPKKLTALAKRNNWSLPEAKRAAMAAANRQPEENPMTDKERADKMAADLAALQAQMSTASDAAVRADRERRSTIMALPEAKGRETLAEHLFNTGSTVEAAKATLAVAPVASAPNEEQGEETEAEIFERRRLNGEGLGGPTPKTMRKGDRSILTAAVDKANARLKR